MQTMRAVLKSVTPVLIAASCAFAQGPEVSYFYDPGTELPWASCCLHFSGGSKHKLPFLPVLDRKTRSPLGSRDYTRDIEIDLPIIFAGSGLVIEGSRNSYRGVDPRGKAVMICPDFPDTADRIAGSGITVEDRVAEAVSRGAGAAILFFVSEEEPFIGLRQGPGHSLDIPVISLSAEGARTVLETTMPYEKAMEKERGAVDLTAHIKLFIASGFRRIETENFTFRYPAGTISDKEMRETAEVNDKSVEFILELFGEERMVWEKSNITYFPDFDSKVFFTAHWGSGFSSMESGGVFSVFWGSSDAYSLAVHENAHTLSYQHWQHSGSCSFAEEGIAVYAQAQATDGDRDNLETLEHLRRNELPRLRDLISIRIGSSSLTFIAYPAASSFAGFVIDRYGLSAFGKAFMTPPDDWDKVFRKTLPELEEEWLLWLAGEYGYDRKMVSRHMSRTVNQD